ncbi:uncharacterized protein LOC129770406 [Toxorhynchites rutilus septentrionalis]|uniref:uncharacterized protein LOC129770406 n=1 Tax=Toxorhynchites rutilus septentrionalis TaxID=329112 RepID=UPI00247AE673|nr:uncharacterized protein LOC129770406 [Toxorhynchites rutilus septentrionalis]
MRNIGIPEKERKCSIPLSTQELTDAELCLIKLVQQEAFEKEFTALTRGEAVHRASKIRWFNPKLTEDGIIRIGGRLLNSDSSTDFKHPIIIPGNHLFSKLLARSYHLRLLHAGSQLMLNSIRLRFWILGGRRICRLVTHQCITCCRAKPLLQQQFMGQLPAQRIVAARPFSTTGIDYFGPVYIKQGYKKSLIKAYVSVFVCFCTKAVHLELVSGLSTAKFLQALRRFTARRGKPAEIFSDNGTNFVGARKELAELISNLSNRKYHEAIQQECSTSGISWHFIPPGAPHFGGLWEAAVRSAKKHLLRVIGYSSVSYEDFLTLLVQIEGCLNSRPLTQLSDDPDDLQPLTPAHFLVGTSLDALPDSDYTSTPSNRLSHWQLIQQQQQHFWRRWRVEYLSQLQARVKNWKPPITIQPGRLVIMVDENQPPMRWRMARIHQVHPGSDGVIRVVTLRTATGFLKRPVTKICMLPLPAMDDQHMEKSSTLSEIK